MVSYARAELKRILARFAGVSPEEISVAGNTTEALNVVLQGVPLERNEEVLYCSRAYPSMQEALEQRALRYDTVNRVIGIPWLTASQDEFLDAAHCFAHLDLKVPDLACDHLGSSLHK